MPVIEFITSVGTNLVKSVVGEEIRKFLHGNPQERAFQEVLANSLKEFGLKHTELYTKLFQENCFLPHIEEILCEYLGPEKQLNIDLLAKRIKALSGLSDKNLEPALNEFLQLVISGMRSHPDLMTNESLRESLGIKEDLTELYSRLKIHKDIEEIVQMANENAKANLEKYCSQFNYPPIFIEPQYSIINSSKPEGTPLEEEDLLSMLTTGHNAPLISGPGTGKTTALLRLGNRLVEKTDVIPIYLSLPEWVEENKDFLEDISLRSDFSGNLNLDGIQALARHGRMVLLLDGWNEVPGDKLRKAIIYIDQFKREYPYVGILLASRMKGIVPQIAGNGDLRLGPVTKEKRDKFISEHFDKEKANFLIDKIKNENTPEEILQIPLYLNVLIEVFKREGVLPNTKEGLVEKFIEFHDKDDRNSIPLESLFRGTHKEYLETIGAHFLEKGTTWIEDSQIRPVIKKTAEYLCEQGQISSIPEPADVLTCLSDHHLLITQNGENNRIWGFQHQQFQEWYASFWVENLIIKFYEGDEGAKDTLTTEVLNIPIWEEAILFATERLNRKSQQERKALANTIVEGLKIDPMLSAEMIHLSDSIWPLVSEKLINFARSWHEDGKIDRGLSFMIATGRPEFSEFIWPLVAHQDHQIRLRALRSFEPFRICVLGEEWQEGLKGQEQGIRKDILSGIAINSGQEGLGLATDLAIDDPSPLVKTGVLQIAHFKNSWLHMEKILEKAPNEVWLEYSSYVQVEEITNKSISDNLKAILNQKLGSTENPPDRLRILLILHKLEDYSKFDQIFREIEHLERGGDSWSEYSLIEQAFEIDQEKTSQALAINIMSGRNCIYSAERFSCEISADTSQKCVEFILNSSDRLNNEAFLAKVLGKNDISRLIEKLFEVTNTISSHSNPVPEELIRSRSNIKGILKKTPLETLVSTILEFDGKLDDKNIGELIEILAFSDSDEEDSSGSIYKSKYSLSKDLKSRLGDKLCEWMELLKTNMEESRVCLVHLAISIGRLGKGDFLPQLRELLDNDIKYVNDVRSQWIQDGRRMPIPYDSFHCYNNHFRGAFENMPPKETVEIISEYLGSKEFSVEAAIIIRNAWRIKKGLFDNNSGQFWEYDFSEVRKNFQKLKGQKVRPDPDPWAKLILDQIRVLFPKKDTTEIKKIMFSLADAVSDMEYGHQISVLNEVLKIDGVGKRGCLLKLIKNGEIIQSDYIKPTLGAIIEKLRKSPWEMEKNWWQVENWLVLLALSDTPSDILDFINALPNGFKTSRHLRLVLCALRDSPALGIDKVLLNLCELIPDIDTGDEWLEAIGNHLSNKAGRHLLNILWEPSKVRKIRAISPGEKSFCKAVSKFLRNYPDSHPAFIEKITLPMEEPIRDKIGEIVANLQPDEEMLLASLAIISNDKATPYSLEEAINNIVLSREPIEEMEGAYNLFPSSASSLRKRLFEMVLGDDERNKEAQRILTWIDKLRDEYGRPENEPRHPNIESGVPWPLIN